jgi:hypothetical protein
MNRDPNCGDSDRLPAEETRELRLPQGCQIEQEFTEQEWQSFLECARGGFASGELLHKDYHAYEHAVGDADVLHAIYRGACLVAYENDGVERIAIWGRGLLVIATVREGLVITAYHKDDLSTMLRSRANVRWLRRLQ